MPSQRSQIQRRTETRQRVLSAATDLFALNGYENTTLEAIADNTGLTIRPIYHYFGNKKQLFTAVVESQERRLLDKLEATPHKMDDSIKALDKGWLTFLEMAKDPFFCQIVLLDAPKFLGRERWSECVVVIKVKEMMHKIAPKNTLLENEMNARILIASLAETALVLAENPNQLSLQKHTQDMFMALIKLTMAIDH